MGEKDESETLAFGGAVFSGGMQFDLILWDEDFRSGLRLRRKK